MAINHDKLEFQSVISQGAIRVLDLSSGDSGLLGFESAFVAEVDDPANSPRTLSYLILGDPSISLFTDAMVLIIDSGALRGSWRAKTVDVVGPLGGAVDYYYCLTKFTDDDALDQHAQDLLSILNERG